MTFNLLQIPLIGLAVYLVAAVALIATDRPTGPIPARDVVDLDAVLTLSYTNLPPVQFFMARDGISLPYRFYQSRQPSNNLLLLIHGSGWHSMQFYPLARAISRVGSAHVITPDLRGHGFAPIRRGDVAYIGQLEDDLADLIRFIRQGQAGTHVTVGGHSSGGGLAVRFAGSDYGHLADGYLLLAPFLKYDAPTTRSNAGGWAQPNTRRIIGLSMLNRLGIAWFNGLKVIRFAMPQAVLDGPLGDSVTPAYSFRLNQSYAPRNDYRKDLAGLRQPFLLVAGADDEAFVAEQYESTISTQTRSGRYVLLPETGHIDLLTNPQLAPLVTGWLADHTEKEAIE